MDKCSELLGPRYRIGKIAFELLAVVCLEHLRIGPVEPGLGKQPVGHGNLAAKAFEEEDGVGVFLAHPRDDIRPRLGRDHVPGVAPKTVDAYPAPEEEDVCHVRAKPRVGIVKLYEIRPLDAPRARRVEAPVLLAAKPLWMVRLESGSPSRVVRGKVDEKDPLPRMHGADQLLELAHRGCKLVKLGHRRIHAKEVGRGERAAVLAHHRVGRRHGKRRQRLHDPKAHLPHDAVKAAGNLAKRSELTREHAVD